MTLLLTGTFWSRTALKTFTSTLMTMISALHALKVEICVWLFANVHGTVAESSTSAIRWTQPGELCVRSSHTVCFLHMVSKHHWSVHIHPSSDPRPDPRSEASDSYDNHLLIKAWCTTQHLSGSSSFSDFALKEGLIFLQIYKNLTIKE